MLQSLPPGWKRLVSSLALGGLVGLVIGLGYLSFRVANARRQGRVGSAASADVVTLPLVDVSGFASRREKGSGSERLTVSVKLRLSAPGLVDCFVYVLAH